jgi:uncharacterized protein (DUF362 family)
VPNPFVNGDGAPILVSVEGRNFDAMLAEGLRVLGGLGALLRGSSDVLINPNFNAAEPYPAISQASSIAALVRETRAATSGRITVADEGFEAGPQVYSYLGLHDAVEAAGGVAEYFSNTYPVRRAESADRPDFRVYALAYDAPVIISMCNVKRHHMATYSGALKNNVGIIAGTEMSSTRAFIHGGSTLIEEVAEVAALVNPELFVVDAMKVLTRSGPSITQGDPVAANRVILCGDMVATDAYCMQLLADHDPTFDGSQAPRVLGRAIALGCGQPDLNQVEIREISV